MRKRESGMALVMTLLVLALASALAIGFFAAVTADQRASGIDRDQTQAYAAAHAGLEKLTTDLGKLFKTDFSPSTAQINALVTTASQPSISGFTYRAPDGSSGYTITPKNTSGGNPAPIDAVNGTLISSGAYQGLRGIITRYDLTATARSNGAETRLRRSLQTVSVPVFQFGVFSDTDLTFYGGDSFDFGGRVHTNSNLFLAEASGVTLSMSDRVTAAGEVIRKQLSNTVTTASGTWTGTVRVLTSSGVYRNLAATEGSKVDGPTSANNEPTWTNLSMGTYNGYIRNGRTGAKRLDLPLTQCSTPPCPKPIEIIRRPVAGEDTTALLFGQRYFGHQDVSMRILLSDTAADITGLPTVTATAPVLLSGNWATTPPNNGIGVYGPVDATHPPSPWSAGPSPAGSATGTTVNNGSSTTTQYNVAAIPNYYKMPSLTVTGGSNTRTATCTGRSATAPHLTGCTWSGGSNVAFPAGTTITAVVTSGWNPHTSTATASAISSGAATITLSAPATGALDFAPTLLFVDGRPATCTGYTTTAFIGCSGLAAAPASGAVVTNGYVTPLNTSTIGGYIKVERKTAGGAWQDVTMEILNLGIGDKNQVGTICADPTPNAVLRIQRLRDNGSNCNYAGSTNPTDWWPQVLYDPREGNVRDTNSTSLNSLELSGVMYYIGLDINNLKRWLAGTIGTTGATTYSNNGYIVYFSDRRNNRNATSQETGEYGYEDIVNPSTAAGNPDGLLNGGEDFNGNGVLDVYGQFPSYNGAYNTVVAGSISPLDSTARPGSNLDPGQARVNRAVLFRRALKLVNGGIVAGVNSLPASGLTVASENPIYVQGNYNATDTSVTGASVPASVVGDAVTILSNNWKDSESFMYPNDPTGRPAINTGYRFAVVSGKGLSFTTQSWMTSSGSFVGSIFGTDGGVGNFLRYIENWNASGRTILYKGSIVSLFTSRQATGTFKCCQNVYAWGVRNYSFDTNFLSPALLPPGTPMFRDVNTLTFRQLLRPTE
ncbi:MAG TPA: hypothetical protein VH417_17220 [Vicinamibacterales bacterium]